MTRYKPRIAAPDEVTITRRGDTAFIQFKDSDEGINLTIGDKIASMTDSDILDLYNAVVLSQLELAESFRPTEIAEGRPQVRFDRKNRRWSAEGHVLRCVVDAGSDSNTPPTIEIDDHKLTLTEFGQILNSFNGWGMRITFVSEDQLCNPPAPEIRKAPKRIPKKVLDEIAAAEAERVRKQAAASNVVSFPVRTSEAVDTHDTSMEWRDAQRLRMAEEVIIEACDASTTKQRTALARKALGLSPDCVQAYLILAHETKDSRKRIVLLRDAVAAGIRTLGPKWEQEYKGHGWMAIETRPLMRAMASLAMDLQTVKSFDEALQMYRQLLELNPSDNQGVRYGLAGCLYETGGDVELENLFKRYADDPTAEFMYLKALHLFRKEGKSKRANKALVNAFETNSFVPIFLSGNVEMPDEAPDRIGFGDHSEAIAYVMQNCYMWDETGGSTTWMANTLAPLLYKQFPGERELIAEVIKELKLE